LKTGGDSRVDTPANEIPEEAQAPVKKEVRNKAPKHTTAVETGLKEMVECSFIGVPKL
jgi:hypothetical protein